MGVFNYLGLSLNNSCSYGLNQLFNNTKFIQMKLLHLKATLIFSAIFFAMVFVSCEDEDDNNDPVDVATTVQNDNDLSSLLAALDKAGLVAAVNDNTPKTIFAPTNAAFNQLFQDLGVSGLNDLDSATLVPILKYHVTVAGQLAASDVPTDATYFPTLTDGPENTNVSLLVQNNGTNVVLNGTYDATVIEADVEATNGIIHKIDKVLLPPTVVDIAVQNGGFTSLVQALTNTGLADTLAQTNLTSTVFAPTDQAFTDASATISGLSSQQVTDVLTYHVVEQANVESSELSDGQVVNTALGQTFTVNINGNNVTITDAEGNTVNVVLTDIQGTNGVVHVVDAVLLPTL